MEIEKGTEGTTGPTAGAGGNRDDTKTVPLTQGGGGQDGFVPQMTPHEALEAVREGGTLLCLGVPPGTKFGIDCTSYTAGPLFMGIKMIPPGVHIIHYCPTDERHKASAPRTSLFIAFKPAEVCVYRWDARVEGLVDVTDQERRQYATGAHRMDFDKKLAPYPLNLHRTWKSLTPHLSMGVLGRLEPIQKFRIVPKRPVSTKTPTGTDTKHGEKKEKAVPSSEKKEKAVPSSEGGGEDEKRSEVKSQDLGAVVVRRRFYSAIPKPSTDSKAAKRERETLQTQIVRLQLRIHQLEGKGQMLNQDQEITSANQELEEAQAKMRTAMASVTQSHLDTTHQLATLSKKNWPGNPTGVLGEMEFAFCSFLIGESLEGLEQWKKLIRLLCNCEKLVDETPALFTAFTEVLSEQLRVLPRDFFEDELLKENFLKPCLKDYMDILRDSTNLPSAFIKALAQLKNLLRSKFGWDYSDGDDDDEGPVVVQLTEKQLAELKIS